MSPADLHSDLVRATLWSDAPGVILGIVLCATGAAAMILYRIRARTKDPALLWFGLFALLYGLRLLFRTTVLAFMAEPVPRALWPYFVAAITYVVAIPSMLFVREILPSSRPVVRWLLIWQAVFAGTGVTLDVLLQRPESLRVLNNLNVLGGWTAFGIHLFRKRKHGFDQELDLGGLRYGLVMFAITVLINNLGSLHLFPLPFDPEPWGFVVFLGSLGSLVTKRAVRNEERLVSLDKELEIATKIQASILPRENPRTEHIRIASRYIPMTAVAGDFYDFLTVNKDRIGVLIADVSGHGVPAALIASMVKVAISSQQVYADDPARVLAGINETLAGKLKGQFVTAAYVFLDAERGSVRYAVAGHPALLWKRERDRGVVEIQQKGLVLGARRNSGYMNIELPYETGDVLLLYTDGLLEARNAAGEQFGVERLKEVLAGVSCSDVDEAAGEIVSGVARWTGKGPQEDDLTVVLIELK